MIAVSVSNLQGLYVDRALRPRYQALFAMKPVAILRRSIWLYDQPEALRLFAAQ